MQLQTLLRSLKISCKFQEISSFLDFEILLKDSIWDPLEWIEFKFLCTRYPFTSPTLLEKTFLAVLRPLCSFSQLFCVY